MRGTNKKIEHRGGKKEEPMADNNFNPSRVWWRKETMNGSATRESEKEKETGQAENNTQ